MKAKYAVVVCLFIGASLGGVGWAIHYNSYEAGKSVTEKEWQAKWTKWDLDDNASTDGAGKSTARRRTPPTN